MTSTLDARHARIAALSERAEHARELLATLDTVLRVQAQVSRAISPSAIEVESFWNLPVTDLCDPFDDFVRTLGPSLTTTLQAAGGQLIEARAHWEELLDVVVRREPVDGVAAQVGCSDAAAHFFAYAFLQPLARRFAESCRQPEKETTRRRCPHCGWPPIAAILQDTAETKGQRTLVCALCDFSWHYLRMSCANCGESAADRLVVHESETHSHIRIDECSSCHAYSKTIDLRKDGRADALVDDVASVELDLWAAERELWKVQRNVFGL